jgi:hypothetical protein
MKTRFTEIIKLPLYYCFGQKEIVHLTNVRTLLFGKVKCRKHPFIAHIVHETNTFMTIICVYIPVKPGSCLTSWHIALVGLYVEKAVKRRTVAPRSVGRFCTVDRKPSSEAVSGCY